MPPTLRKPDALRLPLVHSPLLLPFGGRVRGGGRAARTSASAGAGDSAASSLMRVGIAGSLRSQESPVLADPSPVASSVSAGRRRSHRLPPLLTVAVSHSWFLGRSSRLRRPPPLPLPSRVGRGGVARVRRPFRPLRWQTKRGREKVLLTGSRLCCGWGVVCRRIGGTGGQLEQIPGCYLS